MAQALGQGSDPKSRIVPDSPSPTREVEESGGRSGESGELGVGSRHGSGSGLGLNPDSGLGPGSGVGPPTSRPG